MLPGLAFLGDWKESNEMCLPTIKILIMGGVIAKQYKILSIWVQILFFVSPKYKMKIL